MHETGAALALVYSSTPSYTCDECRPLFAEMRSALIGAKTITQDARALGRASNRSSEKRRQITERWENARRRRVLASAEPQNPAYGTPDHTPFSQERGQGLIATLVNSMAVIALARPAK